MFRIYIYLSIALVFINISHVNAQAEKESYKHVMKKFMVYYNSSQYDSIYAMFSPGMKGYFPLVKTRQLFLEIKEQNGEMRQYDFIRYKLPFALYKASFTDMNLAIKIVLDNNNKINGMLIQAYAEDSLPTIERNTTILSLPFKGQWTVSWGGDTKAQNQHFDNRAQKNAFDLVITDNTGKTHKTDGYTNDDFYAFGQSILAPCDAEVVESIDGIPDNKPGDMNKYYIPGNSVILKTATNEYIVLAHLKQHSVKVKEGDHVTTGQLLGLCGNSGNSSEPHLHFHIQNTEDINEATGVKCYFSHIAVNGKILNECSPVKGDKIEQ